MSSPVAPFYPSTISGSFPAFDGCPRGTSSVDFGKFSRLQRRQQHPASTRMGPTDHPAEAAEMQPHKIGTTRCGDQQVMATASRELLSLRHNQAKTDDTAAVGQWLLFDHLKNTTARSNSDDQLA